MKQYTKLGIFIRICLYIISFLISYWAFNVDMGLGIVMLVAFMLLHIKGLIDEEPHND